MHFRNTPLVIGAAASVVNAVLVPSTFDAVANRLPSSADNVVESRLVKLNCNTCPFWEGKDRQGRDFYGEVPNYLVLNFTVHDNSRLLVNGRQIYPTQFPVPHYQARQVPASVDLVDYAITETMVDVTGRQSPFHNANIGTAVKIDKLGRTPQDLELLKIKFIVGQFENKFVDGLDMVDIELAVSGGKAFIKDLTTSPDAPSIEPGKPLSEQQCTSWPLLCKYKSMIAGSATALPAQPARKHNCAHHRGQRRPQTMQGGPHRHHHHHHSNSHRYNRNSWLQKFARTAASFTMNFLIPVLVGMTAGLTVSLIGVVIAHALLSLWRRVTGTGYVRLEQEDDHYFEDVKEAELPVYEDVVVVSDKENN
jgi:hypothetical protein